MSAYQCDPLPLAQLLRNGLGEASATGTHNGDVRFLNRIAKNGFDSINDRRSLHHHACAATVRSVVSGAMLIVSPVADIVYTNIDEPFCVRSLQDALAQNSAEHRREQCEDIDDQIRVRRLRLVLAQNPHCSLHRV